MQTRRMNNDTRGTLEMGAAMAISGTIGWLVVGSGEPLPRLLFWRCCLGAISLLVFCAASGLLSLPARRTLLLAAAGGAALVGNWLLLFAAYSHASISLATIVYNTQPFMLLALAAVVLGEPLRRIHLAWLLSAFAGVMLISQARPGAAPGDHLTGVLLALGAAFLYAIAALAAKQLRGTPPQLVALVQMTVGTAMLLPWAAAVGFAPATPSRWLHFGTLGVVHTGIMYILLYGAIQRLATPKVAALSFIYPLMALLIDHVVFGVRFGAMQWLGGVLIVAAVLGLNFGAAVAARLRRRPDDACPPVKNAIGE